MLYQDSTTPEISKRVDLVYEMLLQGIRRNVILQYASNKTDWNVSDRQVDTYISKANKLFEKESKIKHKLYFGRAVVRLEDVYARSIKDKDNRTALAVLREMIDFLSLKDINKEPSENNEGTEGYLNISGDD